MQKEDYCAREETSAANAAPLVSDKPPPPPTPLPLSLSLSFPSRSPPGLYKCATVASVPDIARPGFFNQVGRTKWDAWEKAGCSGAKSPDDAKDEYVKLVSGMSGMKFGVGVGAPPAAAADESSIPPTPPPPPQQQQQQQCQSPSPTPTPPPIAGVSPVAYTVRFGSVLDVPFLGTGIRESERDLHGIGIWDIYCGIPEGDPSSDDVLQRALSHVAEHSPDTCAYNYKRFAIATTTSADDAGQEVQASCGCGFIYPESSLLGTMSLLGCAMSDLYGWTPLQVADAASRLSFVEKSYASDVDFDGRFMIEGVYTHPEHRRRGLARIVVQRLIDRGRELGCGECLISCSVGNVPAKSLYESMGFKQVGSLVHNEECMAKLHCAGFFYLRIVY